MDISNCALCSCDNFSLQEHIEVAERNVRGDFKSALTQSITKWRAKHIFLKVLIPAANILSLCPLYVHRLKQCTLGYHSLIKKINSMWLQVCLLFHLYSRHTSVALISVTRI
jgi:hypothetical protein